jgi:hypothetical protein
MIRNQKTYALAIALALFGARAGMAETLTVSGWYAAEERDVAMLYSLGVDRFDGDGGPQLQSAIEGALNQARDRKGGPYFIVRSRYGKADAMVYGTMRTRVDLQDFTRKAKRCAADITSKKCKDDQKIEVDIYCTRRIVTATANIKITRLSDDALIYDGSIPQSNTTENCEGDDRPQSVESVIAGLSRAIASQLADQVTPSGRTENIRIRESRKGMSKEDGNQMKALIARTKTSEAAACTGWLQMEQRGVSHATVKFNLGLCAEAAGQLDVALGYYRPVAVASQNSVDVGDAINRVERRMAGEADDVERNKAMPKP